METQAKTKCHTWNKYLTMNTLARVQSPGQARWYYRDGRPCYELPKKDGSGTKNPTLADAKKLALMPSVTTILRLLDKPELDDWKCEQACLAVLTSPKKPDEDLDKFVHRILHVERVQDQEAATARDLGTEIHDALEKALNARPFPDALNPYILPVVEWVRRTGNVVWTEKVLCGDGYAGRADTLLQNDTLRILTLIDFKSSRTLPKASYLEHRLQTAAYAATLGNTENYRIMTANGYISTTAPGQFVCHPQDNWSDTFLRGFMPLVNFWCWSTNYDSRTAVPQA